MNERKGVLEELLNEKFNYVIRAYTELLISKMLDYYEIYDLDKGTNHCYIFKDLYKTRKKKTYEDISEEYHISDSTLKRYIKRYNRLAVKIIKKDGKVNVINRSKNGLLE